MPSSGLECTEGVGLKEFPFFPPFSGLIGWVPHSDTLHALIRDYREKRKVLLNIEHRLMLRMAQDYDHLPLMNKVGKKSRGFKIGTKCGTKKPLYCLSQKIYIFNS